MRGWAKKWGELIEKGPEYGTTEAAWKGMLTESDRLSDVHLKIKENLCNDVISQIKTWQKDNYHKVWDLGIFVFARFYLKQYFYVRI